MGYEYATATVEVAKVRIDTFLNQSVRFGDWGIGHDTGFYKSSVLPVVTKLVKTKSVQQTVNQAVEKKACKPTDDLRQDTHGVLFYGISGKLGYVAEAGKVSLLKGFRGSLRVENQFFKNVTELKHFLNNGSWDARKLLGEPIYGSNEIVGHVEIVSHLYHKKPAKLPAKYRWLNEQVRIELGGLRDDDVDERDFY